MNPNESEIEYYRRRNKRAYDEGLRFDPFFEIPDRPSKRVLEISAGAGNLVAVPLAVRGHDVVATEYKRETCDFIKRYAGDYGVKIRVSVLDFDSPLCPEGEYDYVFARYCLCNHSSFSQLKRTLDVMKNVTVKGGEHRFMMLSNYRVFQNGECHMLENLSSLKADEVVAMLEKNYGGWNISRRFVEIEQCDLDIKEFWTRIEFKASHVENGREFSHCM